MLLFVDSEPHDATVSSRGASFEESTTARPRSERAIKPSTNDAPPPCRHHVQQVTLHDQEPLKQTGLPLRLRTRPLTPKESGKNEIQSPLRVIGDDFCGNGPAKSRLFTRNPTSSLRSDARLHASMDKCSISFRPGFMHKFLLPDDHRLVSVFIRE
jgi:hypothetical protein